MKTSSKAIRRSLRKLMALQAAVGAIFLAGCTAPADVKIPGGAQKGATQTERRETSGWLQVFSAQGWGRTPEGGPVTFLYSEYKIFAPEGRFVMRVENAGAMEDPSLVRLDPGRYVVEAQAHRRGTVRVPVTITTGKTTVLHLEK